MSADLAGRQEDPIGDAAQYASSYLTLALAAAQLHVHRATLRAARRAQTGSEEQPEPLAQARAAWAPMLGRDRGRTASTEVALRAWTAAQPHRDSLPEADRAAGRAEDRLRVLHPAAMGRYDALRRGLPQVAAMREVVPLIQAEQTHTAARAAFAPLLTDAHPQVSSEQAVRAWTAALPLRDALPDADVAAARAEHRLRTLHPQVMARYDTLRAGSSPEQALRDVTPLLLTRPGPGRSAPTAPAAGATAGTAAAGAGEPEAGRHAPAVRAALPADLAGRVLTDPAWPRLAAALDAAERAGADPAGLLRDVAAQRELTSARSAAQVLAARLTARTPTPADTAADTAAASFPHPPGPTAPTSPGSPDRVAAAAGRALRRAADAAHAAAHAADRTPDEPSTLVDERRDGLDQAAAHATRGQQLAARADQLLDPGTPSPPAAGGPAVTAGRSFPAPPGAATPGLVAPGPPARPPAPARTARRGRPGP